jgi:hypothetical protein
MRSLSPQVYPTNATTDTATAAPPPPGPRLVEEDVELIMEGLCLAMGQSLTEQQLLEGLGAVLQPVLDPLAGMLQQMAPASAATRQPANVEQLRACFPLITRTAVVLKSTGSQQVRVVPDHSLAVRHDVSTGTCWPPPSAMVPLAPLQQCAKACHRHQATTQCSHPPPSHLPMHHT